MKTITDEELKAELSSFGFIAGPITDTTRGILQKKLNSLRNAGASPKTKPKPLPGKKARTSTPPTNVIKESNVVKERYVPLETDFGKDEEEEEEDDHTESSRILSPENHLSFYGAAPYNKNTKKASPVENFKKLAWGFFSRPLGTSTPCSEIGNKYVGYASNKYKRHSLSPDYEAVRFFDSKKISPDISRWISHALVAFFAVLFVTYVAKAHSEAVSNGISVTADFAASTFRFVYSYAFIPIFIVFLVGLFVFGIYKLAAYRNNKKAEENRKLILLVERITDIIYESGSSGVAEPHVRDMIMPPTKRSETDAKRWLEAARFINNEDSRIRTEIRLINGTECNVWIWVGAGKQRWQGTAVLEGSPMARVPEQALARCLKLRGVSFSTNPVERDSIRGELTTKLRPIVPQHIGFVSGAESVVYIMLKDLGDAKDAFMAFHSHWFNGNLLTAKYVRDQRYLERFPDAEG